MSIQNLKLCKTRYDRKDIWECLVVNHKKCIYNMQITGHNLCIHSKNAEFAVYT